MLRIITIFYNSFICFFLLNLFLLWNKLFFGFNFLINIINIYWINMKYFFYIDSISLFFIILSIFVLVLCVFMCWYWSYRLIFYLFLIFICVFCLINVFLVNDILLLFIFFELIVLPLFLIVGVWGSRDRKVYASYLLFIYTLLGSAFALFGFLILYYNKGSFNFIYLNNNFFLEYYQLLIILLLFFGFSVKVPIIPIHIWLPEAHVEAPTIGSVILAAIILKLGIYVYFRLVIFIFPFIVNKLIGLFFLIAFLSVYIASFSAIAQIDIKKIIAYSSIAHMNFALIGLFCNNLIALMGSLFLMFGHAIVSGALFFSIGILYDRFKTRILFYYGGLVLFMPVWVSLFFIFILGNFGFPGTSNFVGEFIIFIGSFFSHNLIILLMSYSLFLTLIYSLFLYNRLVYGFIKIEFIRFFSEISKREFFIIFSLFFFIIFFGIFPNFIFDYNFNSIFFWFLN